MLRQRGFTGDDPDTVFPCHERHPEATMVHDAPAPNNDCVGWAQYLSPERLQRYPHIVHDMSCNPKRNCKM
jgi:hypothetical protein